MLFLVIVTGKVVKSIFVQARELMKLMTSDFRLVITLALIQVLIGNFVECQYSFLIILCKSVLEYRIQTLMHYVIQEINGT